MAIPDYQTVMLPLLCFASDNREHSLREAVDTLAKDFKLTDDELREVLPSGQQPVFNNRVSWARVYLTKARLLEATRRGHFQATQRGLEVLAENPERIDAQFLRRFSEFEQFKAFRRDRTDSTVENDESSEHTPEEVLESAYQRIRQDLETEVLERVKVASPTFFERLVVELLVRMGYGGTRQEAGKAIGRSGDGGIDGIINEDRLGLDVIYIQAKRWDQPVGRPEIQKFAGALQGYRARKGVFITTSSFSRDALDYVGRIDSKIVLVDGETLASLMVDHNVGVSQSRAYEIKRVDSDYFEE
jgi:restriction system protein